MNDTRVDWVRDKLISGLKLRDSEIFSNFLRREHEQNDRKLLDFLDQTASSEGNAIIFYTQNKEQDEEIEVETGIKTCIFENYVFEMLTGKCQKYV